MSAGASVECCDRVFSSENTDRKIDSAFAAIRPPGHHASCQAIRGFCLLNNAAIATKYVQGDLGKKKVCIFDWDIHVGDGTSEIFYEDDSVLYISMHRYDDGMFYPGKGGSWQLLGKDKGLGYNVHFGFNAYSNPNISDLDYIFASSALLMPIIKEF